MRIGVKILPRDVILDTQGRAVAGLLKQKSQKENLQDSLKNCRVGRYVELELATDDKESALKEAKEIAGFVLHNPLIEKYELEVL